METIELKNFPMDVKYFVEEFDYIYQINVSIPMTCRDSGNPGRIFHTRTYFKEDISLPEAIRETIKWILAHEVDECLLVNGERIFDPHKV